MRKIIAALVVTTGLAGVALADARTAAVDQVSGAPKLTPDGNLINKIHAINLAEQSMAKVALENSDSQRVKDFANKMIKDHGDSDDTLVKLAKAIKVPVVDPESTQRAPSEIAEAKHGMAMERRMKDEKGTTFDREYLKMMVAGHGKALQMLTSATPSDPGLEDFVNTMIPVVRQHQRLAAEISQPGIGRRPMR